MKNTCRIHLFAFFISACFLLAGCGGPTFPKDKLVDSLEKLCKEEYNIDVSAKVTGQTLGIYLQLDRLIGSLTGQVALDEAASEVIENVLICARRVTLSTDSDVKFFTLIGADKLFGYELRMTHYIKDVHRVMVMNISRSDYFQRIMYNLHPSPTIQGKRRIFEFFKMLGSDSVENVIRRNFIENVSIKDISPSFFLHLLEAGMKEKSKYKILEIKDKPVDKEKIVYYVRAREIYQVKPEFAESALSFPPDFIHEYMILVDSKSYPALIERIAPLTGVNKEGNTVSIPLPDEFNGIGDPATWKENDFYLEDAQLPDFIAFQVAQKIRGLIAESKNKLEESSTVENVEASFVEEGSFRQQEGLPQRSIFQLIFTLPEKSYDSQPQKVLSKPLLKLSMDALEKTCKNYDFSDFSGIRVLDAKETEILNIDKSMIKTLIGK